MKSYRGLLPVFVDLGKSMVLGQTRSFNDDCAAAVSAFKTPPVVLGPENIPASCGFLLVANHWQRSGHWIGFTAAALTMPIVALRGPSTTIRWITTDRWNVRRGEREFHLPFTGTLFRRVARTWGLIPISTNARRPIRPGALRGLLDRVESGDIAGLFPEGEWARAGRPGNTAPGAGHLARLLAARNIPTVPAAFLEHEGRAYVRYGAPFLPERGQGPVDLTAVLRREYDLLTEFAAAQ